MPVAPPALCVLTQRLLCAAPQSYKASHVEDGSAGSGKHTFMLLPGPSFTSFSFRLAGLGVEIASLTCRLAPSSSSLSPPAPRDKTGRMASPAPQIL